jgi:hypothetical protein
MVVVGATVGGTDVVLVASLTRCASNAANVTYT